MPLRPPRTALLALLTLLLLPACAPVLGRPAGGAPGGLLGPALEPLLADTALAHAHWGVLVQSTRTGETRFAHNAGRLFVPASNQKLVTGAAVLETLGPDYRFRTEIATSGPIQNGVLRGPLVIRGFGDPTVSGRFTADPRDRFREFADSLRARGIHRVSGGLIGIDSAFTDGPLGSGWAWDDVIPSYAAAFGALQFSDGAVEVSVVPSQRIGEPAVVILSPGIQYVSVTNQTVTGPPGSTGGVSVQRDAVGPGLIISGQIAAGADPVRRMVAIRDPTLFYLSALRETLREAGIAVEGPAMDADDLAPEDPAVRRAIPLFTYRSPPLHEILPVMMKPSQNQIAEILLRAVGMEIRGRGSASAGAEVVDSLFRLWGLPAEKQVADGSGLSRYNLVSPALLSALLLHMDRSHYRETWIASLPVAGVDGTLANRLRGTPLAGNVHAKTGTLSGVRSLSGYLTTRAGEPVTFSILVNHHVRSAADADRVIDALLHAIWEN